MTDPRPTIGFIGLGLMGQGFVKRLRANGYLVVGFDIEFNQVESATKLGAMPAASAADVAGRADIILISVTTTDAVADVIAGANGIRSCPSPRVNVVVDHSTTEVETTLQAVPALRSKGIAFIDAPVSGGPGAAEEGTLAIMAGGDAIAIETIRPVMDRLGRFTHMGPVGAGQATKLVNQTLVLTNYCVMAEALRLAQAYDVDVAKIPHALETGHAGSNLLTVAFPRMVAEDFAPRGYARQVLKDLEMLNNAAAERHLAMPMAGQALTLYRMLVAGGKSELDAGAVVNLLPKAER